MQQSVTVLITVRNNISTIKPCIDSILSQTYKNYKIYVVDAFSTDGTYEILKNYGKKIKLEQLKSNPPKAYNHAIRKIDTTFIAFTNGDCTTDKHWLEEILKPFSDNKVVATAGYVTNPKNPESKLQEIIGRELEQRYKEFPKEISRAPEMNLCIRSNVMKKLKFDETLDVSYDADLGYRLTKDFGKMIYQKSAIVYHYHRPSWKGYFKQQYTYAKFVPKVYLRKHKAKILGDNISKTSMMMQILFIYLMFLNLLLTPLNLFFIYFSLFFFVILLLSYFFDMVKLIKEFADVFWFLALFIIRNVAWSIGILVGTVRLLKK